MNKGKEHPEVRDLHHICKTSPNTPGTKSVCKKVNEDKKTS